MLIIILLKQIVVRTHSGELVDRLSPWATYVVPPPRSEGWTYKQKIWHPHPHEVSILAYIIMVIIMFELK